MKKKANFFGNRNKWLRFLVSAWDFDYDGSDRVGSNNGTGTSVSYVSGLVGNCLDVTASTSSCINIPDNDSLSFGNSTTETAHSISLLIKFSSLISINGLIDKRNTDGSGREYSLWYDNSVNAIVFRKFDQSTGGYIQRAYTWTPSLSTWYHIFITDDGNALAASTSLKLYLNGTIVGNVTSSGSYTAMENGGGDLVFGKFNNSTSFSLNGYVDQIKIYNKEMSASEVSEIATDELAGINILN